MEQEHPEMSALTTTMISVVEGGRIPQHEEEYHHPRATIVGMSAQQVIDGVHGAVTRGQRIHALKLATVLFHHSDERSHDYEMQLGAAHALCLKLGYAMAQLYRFHNDSHNNTHNDNTHSHTHNPHSIHNHSKSHNENESGHYEELSSICHAFQMVHGGCSMEQRVHCFMELGRPEVVPLLIQLVQELLHHATNTMDNIRDDDDDEPIHDPLETTTTPTPTPTGSDRNRLRFSPNQVDLVVKCLQIFRIWAKLHHDNDKKKSGNNNTNNNDDDDDDDAKTFIIEYNRSHLLKLLVQMATGLQYDEPRRRTNPTMQEERLGHVVVVGSNTNNNCHAIHKDGTYTGSLLILVELFGFLKDLSFRCRDGPKATLLYVPGLLDMMTTIVATSTWSTTTQMKTELEGDYHCKLREHAASFLWNMALAPNLRAPLAEHSNVLNLLHDLISGNSTTANGNTNATVVVVKTRKNALSALGNIANDPRARLGLWKHGRLLSSLQTVVTKDDTDRDARRRAMRTIRWMTLGNATQWWVDHDSSPTNGLEFLVRVIQHDPDLDTQCQACETLVIIASEVAANTHNHNQQQQHGQLHLESTMAAMLRILEGNTNVKCMDILSRGLTMFIEGIVGSNEKGTTVALNTHGIVQALSKLANGTNHHSQNWETKESVARLLYKVIVCSEDPTICVTNNNDTMNVLADFLSQTSDGNETTRDYCAKTIVALAKEQSNRKQMVEHPTLLTSFVNYTLLAPEGETRNEAKQTILLLVPSL
eukprot:scaffold98003_cov55-Attheya_sp.AAC.2